MRVKYTVSSCCKDNSFVCALKPYHKSVCWKTVNFNKLMTIQSYMQSTHQFRSAENFRRQSTLMSNGSSRLHRVIANALFLTVFLGKSNFQTTLLDASLSTIQKKHSCPVNLLIQESAGHDKTGIHHLKLICVRPLAIKYKGSTLKM